jgi:protein-disulfide isomerase
MSRHVALPRLLGLALAAGLAAVSGAAAASAPEHALGSPKAAVTVVEYASVGCPHCATWANQVFPAFKKQWIDTGKVRFVFHEMITGDSELAVAGFMVADCASPDKYFQVVDAIFADQVGVAQGGGAALLKVAQAAGMTPAQFDACLTDHRALADLQARTDKDAQDHGVEFTPTFFVNGQKMVGDPTLKDLSAAIESAERAHRKG